MMMFAHTRNIIIIIHKGNMSNIQIEKIITNNGHMNKAATIEIPVRGI
jgi:hypothetical protein